MNATSFLTNISKSLKSLEEQSELLSTITNNNEFKLGEIHKNITELATLVQQQNNCVDQHIKSIEENISKLESNQIDILNKINEVLSRVESSVNQNGFLIKSRRRKKFQSVNNDSLSESDENDKLNPYDLTPTLVALIRNKMKENEQNNEDSETSSVENEFSFDYSKSFTHKDDRKVLKAYLLFYMKDYESRGDKLSDYI